MARSQRTERPVSEEEFEEMPSRITRHFDRIRTLLRNELDAEDD